jgi:6-phosphofructokinase 1
VRRLVTVRAGLWEERHQSADVLVGLHQLSLVGGREMKASESRHGQDVITVKLLRIHGFLASSDRAGFIATLLHAQLCTEIAKRKDRARRRPLGMSSGAVTPWRHGCMWRGGLVEWTVRPHGHNLGLMKHIAVLTSGGDAPGMNAAIRAVTRSALDQGMTVYGVRQGWQGLVDGQFRQLSARDVGGIIQVGGTFLGSARSAEFRAASGRSKALRNLTQRGIDGVVVIGGNGSQTGSYMISQLGVHVVGIASTIDNDLLGTDISIGCDTAINVTLEAIDHLRTTGSSHNRAFLVETMGRDCGYLAMMAGLAGGAEVISTPEFEVSASEIAQRLRAAFERGKTHAIVVIAEGVKENAAKILAYFDADRQRTGFELRATTLGHVVRGAPPSAFDRLLATRLGVNAVKSLSNGETGVLVGYQRNEVTRTPLADIIGRTKPMDTELLELARILAK